MLPGSAREKSGGNRYDQDGEEILHGKYARLRV
jgi:hypothetical protein